MDPELEQQLRDLLSDWQANGNSRELGDPTSDVWHKCATQLLTVLEAQREAAPT